MQNFNLEKTFHTCSLERDNFLSRVFGVFNEDIVRIWCKNQESSYTDLGRPSFYNSKGKYTHTTLDFTLEDTDKHAYVAEMKCELAFEKYKYLELDLVTDLRHHKKIGFKRFLKMAREPGAFEVRIAGENGTKIPIKGAILIWGHVNTEHRDEIAKHFNFHDILSLQDIINDLIEWNDKEYYDYIAGKHEWITEMINYLSIKSDLPQ